MYSNLQTWVVKAVILLRSSIRHPQIHTNRSRGWSPFSRTHTIGMAWRTVNGIFSSEKKSLNFFAWRMPRGKKRSPASHDRTTRAPFTTPASTYSTLGDRPNVFRSPGDHLMRRIRRPKPCSGHRYEPLPGSGKQKERVDFRRLVEKTTDRVSRRHSTDPIRRRRPLCESEIRSSRRSKSPNVARREPSSLSRMSP